MTRLKSALLKRALVVPVAAGVVAATAFVASAEVACNRFGDCWRVHQHYNTYPSDVGVVYHDDDWWAGHPAGNWRWRDRGYYDHTGVWIRF